MATISSWPGTAANRSKYLAAVIRLPPNFRVLGRPRIQDLQGPLRVVSVGRQQRPGGHARQRNRERGEYSPTGCTPRAGAIERALLKLFERGYGPKTILPNLLTIVSVARGPRGSAYALMNRADIGT
jgi:hypothetical protein